MIDIWLVFNLFKPFVDILLHTYVETISDETDFHNYAEETEEEDPTRPRSAWSPDKVSKEKAEAVEAMRLESRSRIHLITYLLHFKPCLDGRNLTKKRRNEQQTEVKSGKRAIS